MNVKEIKKGAILSYALIVINTLYGLFFTPFLIGCLGNGEYGVYKIIGSFIGSLTVLDLGIGSTVLRYGAKFYARKEYDELNNFFAMGMIQAGILAGIMLVASVFMYFFIDVIYSNSLSVPELTKAKQLFVLFAILLMFNTFEKVIFAVTSATENYGFANGSRLVRIIVKMVLVYLLLTCYKNSAIILYIEIGILVITMITQLIYLERVVKIRIKFTHWDMKLFKSSMKYTILMFMQSIAIQFSGSLDNMVIGAVIGSTAVAIYSIGLQLYNMYEQFAIAFSELMLPTVSKQIAEGADNRQLEDTVIKVGRMEFIALGAALCGFLIIGREFIDLWLGKGYLMAWWVGIILMIPTTIPLMQNVCLSILRAKNKMQFRTIAVCCMAIFNLVITVIGVKLYGPLAACIGTAVCLICANIIAMNVYYFKVLKINVFRIFKGVLSRSWVCCLIASGVLYLSDIFIYGSWIKWIVKVCIFLVVYVLCLCLYGFNKREKEVVFGKILYLLKGERGR